MEEKKKILYTKLFKKKNVFGKKKNTEKDIRLLQAIKNQRTKRSSKKKEKKKGKDLRLKADGSEHR